MKTRTLVRHHFTDSDGIEWFCIPGWSQKILLTREYFHIPWVALPCKRFYAEVNLDADSPDELDIRSFEAPNEKCEEGFRWVGVGEELQYADQCQSPNTGTWRGMSTIIRGQVNTQHQKYRRKN